MGFRVRKSIKIAKGVRLTVGKKSIGLSAGVKGARISTNTRTGTRATISAPGTGLSYSTKVGGSAPRRRSHSSPSISSAPASAPLENKWIAVAGANRVFSDEVTSVAISANVVVWPILCPCCGASFAPPYPPGAKQVGPNSYVVKMKVPGFAPPLCPRCQDHVSLASQAPASADGLEELGANWLIGCGCGPIMWVVAFAVLSTAMDGGLAFILSVSLIGLVVAAGIQANNKKAEEKADAARGANIAHAKRIIDAMSPRCCHYAQPVIVEQVHGSLRTFHFRNETFASIFMKLNDDKIVY